MTYLASKSKSSVIKNTLIAGNVKMADLMIAEGAMLSMLPSFGIEMGFGEKTIEQICAEYEVSLPLFLLVCNLYAFDEYTPDGAELNQISIEDVVRLLQNAHVNFLKTSMLQMIANVTTLAELHIQPETRSMLSAFCEKYRQDVVAHIQYEEDVLFPYVRRLLDGKKTAFTICGMDDGHKNIATVLRDLRNIIIKYAPASCSVAECMPVLGELFMFEYELRKHSALEYKVLIPLMERLRDGESGGCDSADLSERERQTLISIACGLSNKEIADKLQISIHTVVSHRKNIIRKTGIRTAPGLTLYAYINHLVSPKDLR